MVSKAKIVKKAKLIAMGANPCNRYWYIKWRFWRLATFCSKTDLYPILLHRV